MNQIRYLPNVFDVFDTEDVGVGAATTIARVDRDNQFVSLSRRAVTVTFGRTGFADPHRNALF
jgi:hypothetical protein